MIGCERYVPEDDKFCNEYVMWKIFKYCIAVYLLFHGVPHYHRWSSGNKGRAV